MEERDDSKVLSNLLERAQGSGAPKTDRIVLSKEEAIIFQRLSMKEQLNLLATLYPTRVQWVQRAPSESEPQLHGVHLRMVADGLLRLHLHLQKSTPFDLSNQFRHLVLLDYGSESLVLLAQDSKKGEDVVMKVAFCDYTDVSRFDLETLRRRQDRLAKEARILTIMNGTALPRFMDLVKCPNPLYPKSFPDFIRSAEVFLSMEHISGIRVDLQARSFHKSGRTCCAQKLAIEFAIAHLSLQQEIFNRLGRSIYTDIKPENALLTGGRIRIVDGSSIDLAEDKVVWYPKVSLLYLHPSDAHRYLEGTPQFDEGYVLRSVARCAQILACNSPAVAGEPLPPWKGFVLTCVKSAIDLLANCKSNIISESIDRLKDITRSSICDHL